MIKEINKIEKSYYGAQTQNKKKEFLNKFRGMEKGLKGMNHRGHWNTPKTAEDFIPYNDPDQPGSYLISIITCAHNLFHNKFHKFKRATFSFGQHGGEDTI